MKGRSSLPNDPKIIVCICFGAFWIAILSLIILINSVLSKMCVLKSLLNPILNFLAFYVWPKSLKANSVSLPMTLYCRVWIEDALHYTKEVPPDIFVVGNNKDKCVSRL